MSDIRRQTAYKCDINSLLNYDYVQQQGLNPNFLDFNGLKVSRVNVLAILVSKEGNTLTIDDGSGQIQVMLFDDYQKNNIPSLGELVLLVGKPREYNGKRFLVPEILRVLDNHKWLELRKKELEFLNYGEIVVKREVKDVSSDSLISGHVENHQETILKKIKELDKGDGAPFQDLVKALTFKDVEKHIEDLLKEGEIFEVKGKLKIL